ncbi:MAG: PSP1 domain-containing protein, partial [Tumebacillaceae bacterium]
FDRNKIIFYFTADGRVDFRELVKDLASVFRTRIELRQIGVRDEAKLLGGIGPCGRILCCSSWLGDFDPVSIRMAKDQNLSLNPAKISGLCGRLMCCLKFETESYDEENAHAIDIGTDVKTPNGKGTVTGVNTLEKTVQVELVTSKDKREFSVHDVQRFAD